MIVPVALAVAFACGVEWRRIALLAVAVYLPAVAGAAMAVIAWRARPGDDSRPVMFCEGVAAELRAGATLSHAIETTAAAVGRGFTGSPDIVELASGVADRFPELGEELRLTISNAARAGSDVAALFDEVASVAITQTEIRREVRVATAPGRATALLLVGAPLVYLVGRSGSGDLANMVESSRQRTVLLLGLGLFMLGVLGSGFVVWRAGR
ncbi:MAG: hypothetical protein WAL25_03875 [Acidimicrobiia bacterium]